MPAGKILVSSSPSGQTNTLKTAGACSQVPDKELPMPPSLQARVAKLTEVWRSHLVVRKAELGRTPRRTDKFDPLAPHDHPHEQLAAETASLERMIAMLESARSKEDLISVYDHAKSLQPRVIEFPSTAGEDAAGLYAFTRIRDLLDDFGIDPKPMKPAASPSPKREA
jgi:hypothetical protein